MTDTTTDTTAPQEATSGPQGTEPQPDGPQAQEPPETPTEPDDDGEADESPNAEAAKWRRRLRETEAERDLLRSQVETMQRTEVDRIVRQQVDWSPAVLWEAGLTVDMVTAEDGTIDTAKVETAVRNTEDRLGLRPRVGYSVDHSKTTDGMRDIGANPWQEAFQPQRR